MKLSVHIWRWSLIALCALISVVMFIHMNRSYDPLARYPYVSEYNRDIILEYLDSDEIDYMINQQLRPAQFMPFINTEDFNIRNSTFYTAAYETRPEDRETVVHFVNRYRKYFTLDSLRLLLKHYSYEDLTNFIETQLVLHEDLVLSDVPDDPYLVLSDTLSVYKYEPEDLTDAEGIRTLEPVAAAWQTMAEDYALAMDDESSLVLASGYQSYETVLNEYSRLSNLFGSNASKIYLPGGENEAQLGFTLTLKEQEDWLELLQEHPGVLDTMNSTILLREADEDLLSKADWLESNAWRYGFIIRYPMEGQNETGHIWQPFVLRYVGKDNARAMMEEQAVMETFDFSA